MSEIGYLSNQHKQLAHNTQDLNEAVLILKKEWLLKQAQTAEKYPNLKITSEDLAEARAFLTQKLQEMLPALPNEAEITEVIQLVDRDLPLQLKHFDTLDKMLQEMDRQRTVLFKQLRMGRG